MRIQRVDPQWDGRYIERETVRYAQQAAEPASAEAGVGRYALVAAAIAGAHANEPTRKGPVEDADFEPLPDPLDQETARRVEIPLLFVQHCHEPLGAHALVYCLLIGAQKPLQQAQLNVITAAGIPGLDTLVTTLYPGVCGLGPSHHLPLVEMCLPALKSMSAVQYRTFKDVLVKLIRVDHQTDLREGCLFQLVRHYLEPEFIRVRPSRERANVEVFGLAVRELADCYPLQKPRLLKAMTLAARSDGTLSPTEQEIIASVAAVMDCPMPSLAVSGTEQA